MKSIDDLPDLNGRTVLLRLDLNVPVDTHRQVSDTTRIDRAAATIKTLMDKGAKLMIASHFGRPKGAVTPEFSLDFLAPVLSSHWGYGIRFVRDCIGTDVAAALETLPTGDILLLENLRFYSGEESNDPAFARMLALPADLIVNDAFSVSHRAHASVVGVMAHKPGYAGHQMAAEINALESALTHPDRPMVAVIGGSKISTKLDLLNHIVDSADHLILGGGMANTFIAAHGRSLGKSLVEPDMLDTARMIADKAKTHNCTIHLPLDGLCADRLEQGINPQTLSFDNFPDDMMVLDAGPQTVEQLKPVIAACKTLIWNGPMGAFEFKPFDSATNALAAIVAERTISGKLISIAGGGDTVAALNGSGHGKDMSYLSTAGGAFLEWMEGKKLPGIAALTD